MANNDLMPLSPIEDILADLRTGKLIVLVDDENRENEGDLVCAAEKITPEIVNFMLREARGYMCLALTGADCDRIDLQPQAALNTSLRGTPLTVTIDAHPRFGVGTGVSARDRAKTIQLAIDPSTRPEDFVRPGHINPLRARNGGVLERTGQTEGSIDLARMAGLHPSAVIIEIVREDGEMARPADLERFCAKHGLRMCSIEQIIEHRLARERLVSRLAPLEGTPIETPHGRFNLFAYQSATDALPHVALTVGGIGEMNGKGAVKRIEEPVLVRMHRRDLLGDIFDEASNPTGRELRASLRMIQRAGKGALVYLRPEGVGDGLRDRLLRIHRPEGVDANSPNLSVPRSSAKQPADMRDFGVGAQILLDLGLSRVRILTNHPKSLPGLHAFGLEVVEQVSIDPEGTA
jgi:3,4-dihydroxy 2-butanone 4-phosphate synthase/GTP cyclohydrolase II